MSGENHDGAGRVCGTVDPAMLRAALKDAEEELCSLGHQLVHRGLDTLTTAQTLDLIRICLYGTDGAGKTLSDFAQVRDDLQRLRAEPAASTENPTSRGGG